MSVLSGIKSLIQAGRGSFPFPQNGGSYGANDPWGGMWRYLSGSTFDYRREAGVPWENSIVMGGVSWAMRNFPRARLLVERPTGKLLEHGEEGYAEVRDHPFTLLWNRPNPYYSKQTLMKGLLLSRMVDANAFIRIQRNLAKTPFEIYYVPHFLISPRWDQQGKPVFPSSSSYIQYWEYRVDGKEHEWEPDEVFHWRDGIDPVNQRRGLSALTSCLREIAHDNCASTVAASMMRNNNIPGLMVSSKMSTDGKSTFAALTPDQEEKVRGMAEQKFRGDRAGEMMVVPVPIEVSRLSFDPTEMDMSRLRRIDEERILAQWGIPLAVAGFGSGLEQTKVGATMKSMVDLAWDQCIIPMQDELAEDLTFWAQRDFADHFRDGERVAFDRSKIPALAQDVNEVHDRVRKDWQCGLIKRSEGRRILGKTADALDEVYYPIGAKASLPSDAGDEDAGQGSQIDDVESDQAADHAGSVQGKRKSVKSAPAEDDNEPDEEGNGKSLTALLLLLLGQQKASIVRESASAFTPGTIFSKTSFTDSVMAELSAAHTHAAWLGRLRAGGAGSIGSVDRVAGAAEALTQRPFVEKLAEQLGAGEVSQAQVSDRAAKYAQRLVGTANGAWKEALPSDAAIYWRDTGDSQECTDCEDLAAGSPYTKDSLPSVPGDASTACQTECRCYLETDDGKRSFYDPRDGDIAA